MQLDLSNVSLQSDQIHLNISIAKEASEGYIITEPEVQEGT